MTMEEARFREAFTALRASKRLKAMVFAESVGVTKSYISHTVRETHRPVPVGWFGELCRRYGVSAEWLLTGDGDMFTK